MIRLEYMDLKITFLKQSSRNALQEWPYLLGVRELPLSLAAGFCARSLGYWTAAVPLLTKGLWQQWWQEQCPLRPWCWSETSFLAGEWWLELPLLLALQPETKDTKLIIKPVWIAVWRLDRETCVRFALNLCRSKRGICMRWKVQEQCISSSFICARLPKALHALMASMSKDLLK